MIKIFTIIKEASERVPGKNFRVLGGKPLWRWLVDELSEFDLYINTDSISLEEQLGSFSNVTCIRRSQRHIDWELNAGALGSPVMDMVRQFCDESLGVDEDFALVHVTSPFLKADTLKRAYSSFDSSVHHSAHSVKHIQDALMRIEQGAVVPTNFTFDNVQRTQDLAPVYQSLGAFFIMNSRTLLESNLQRLSGDSILIPLSPVESIEIDTEEDFDFADLIAHSMNKRERKNEYY